MHCMNCGSGLCAGGKYCPSCGKRTGDVGYSLRVFRAAERKSKRDYINSKPLGNRLFCQQIASFAWDRAVGDNIPSLDIYNFQSKSKAAWASLDKADERAEVLYQAIKDLLADYPHHPDSQ